MGQVEYIFSGLINMHMFFFKQTDIKMALSIISLVQVSKMGYHYETFKMFNISSQLCTGCFSLPVLKFIIQETNKQGYFVSNVTYWKVKSSTISSVHSFTIEFAFFLSLLLHAWSILGFLFMWTSEFKFRALLAVKRLNRADAIEDRRLSTRECPLSHWMALVCLFFATPRTMFLNALLGMSQESSFFFLTWNEKYVI